jgi:hypothetical protein
MKLNPIPTTLKKAAAAIIMIAANGYKKITH